MNAIQLLRAMHAETKVQFKILLGEPDGKVAAQLWQQLKPMLELHEALEDQHLYTPLAAEHGQGTPLGDWEAFHQQDVAAVQALVKAVDQFASGTPVWRMAVGSVMDTLARHVTDEEAQVLGRVEQLWGSERLEKVGAEMQKQISAGPAARQPVATSGKKS
jgi:hypothetical protein